MDPSQLIRKANQLTGFCMMTTKAFNELILGNCFSLFMILTTF